MRFTFGEFVLDCDTRQLLRGGRPVRVSPKELALLELLLRARPRAVSRTRPGVSRRHARIQVRGGRATLEDLASKNGTFVDGVRLAAARVLHDGDVIRLGHRAKLVFRSHAQEPTTSEDGGA